jgi:hypothetical protein
VQLQIGCFLEKLGGGSNMGANCAGLGNEEELRNKAVIKIDFELLMSERLLTMLDRMLQLVHTMLE